MAPTGQPARLAQHHAQDAGGSNPWLEICTDWNLWEKQEKEPNRHTFFIRPGDKQLYKMSHDWEENLHKA